MALGEGSENELQNSSDLMLSGQPKAAANTEPTAKRNSKQFGFLHIKFYLL